MIISPLHFRSNIFRLNVACHRRAYLCSTPTYSSISLSQRHRNPIPTWASSLSAGGYSTYWTKFNLNFGNNETLLLQQRVNTRFGGASIFQRRLRHTTSSVALDNILDNNMPAEGSSRKRTGSSARYEEAVLALNNLQSNAAQIEAKLKQKRKQNDNIEMMQKSLQHLGIHPDDLNKLNIVHIAGTKGKGSTAALTESILRKHGYKTGFFSSPHLVEVRERIRLNGSAISAELFTHYFWQVYDTLKSNLEPGETMPPYFKFLTLLSFKIFLNENVNAAILEVGIGGRFDNTNVITQPVVCGITSLGIDHTRLLGNTIEDISWQKAGIMKSGCPAVSVRQYESSMRVLSKYSDEVGCALYEAPPFDARQRLTDVVPRLGMAGSVQMTNASLAVQLCRIFLDRQVDSRKWTLPTQGDCVISLADLDETTLEGLAECKWPGRFHTVKRPGVTYYFDGAHTVESVSEAFKWFRSQAAEEKALLIAAGSSVKSVFLFNKTGDRSAEELMTPIADQRSEFSFDYTVFCPNLISNAGLHSDCKDRRVLPSKQLSEVTAHRDAWMSLNGDSISNQDVKLSDDISEFIVHKSHHNQGSQSFKNPTAATNVTDIVDNDYSASLKADQNSVLLFSSLNTALSWLGRGLDTNLEAYANTDSLPYIAKREHLQVFITGSLYLVGNSFMCLNESVK